MLAVSAFLGTGFDVYAQQRVREQAVGMSSALLALARTRSSNEVAGLVN